jgi:hypothetical protein
MRVWRNPPHSPPDSNQTASEKVGTVQFGWKLVLHPHWRPLFLLGMVLVMGGARTAWRAGERQRALLGGGAYTFVFLMGSAMAGLVPLSGGWWAQGLIPAVIMFTYCVALTVFTVSSKRASLFDGIRATIYFSGLCFSLGAALYFVSGVDRGAGILTFGGIVAVLGASLSIDGILRSKHFQARVGLTTVGGFVAAGLILAADALVRAFG